MPAYRQIITKRMADNYLEKDFSDIELIEIKKRMKLIILYQCGRGDRIKFIV